MAGQATWKDPQKIYSQTTLTGPGVYISCREPRGFTAQLPLVSGLGCASVFCFCFFVPQFSNTRFCLSNYLEKQFSIYGL